MSTGAANLAVVIAAYNEAANIKPLTERLIRVLDDAPGIGRWCLIYVVDGDDGSADTVASFSARRKEIRLDHQSAPAGLGAAFRRGFRLVPMEAEWVVTMDADLNHQPEEIPRLLEAGISQGAGIVVGSRRTKESTVEGAPPLKTAVSRVVNRFLQLLTGSKVVDMTSGFRVYRADFIRSLTYQNDGFAFLPEILIGATSRGARIIEEPIQFIFRRAGVSKLDIPSTGISYIALLTRQSLRSPLPIVVLLAFGVALAYLVLLAQRSFGWPF
jgi:dolichol-phosphate mannosyltransferase